MATQTTVQPRLLLGIRRKLAWFVQPSSNIHDEQDRQRFQLLSGLLLTTFAVVSFIVAYALHLSAHDIKDPRVISGILAILLSLLFYGVNRLGYLQVAASGFVISLAALFIIASFGSDNGEFLAFAVIPMLIAGLFFSPRQTAIVVCSIIGIVFIWNYLPQHFSWTRQLFWYLLLLTGALVLVIIRHINRLDRLRRESLEAAIKRLQDSEALLEKRVQERTRFLELATTVAKQVASVLELDTLLADIAERTRSVFDLRYVSVFLYDDVSDTVLRSASTGRELKVDSESFSVADTQGIIPRAAATRQAILLNTVAQPSNAAPAVSTLPQAELALPMLVGGQLIGILDLQSGDSDKFTDERIRILTSLADQIAVAVQNASLYSQQVKVAQELRALDTLKSQFLAGMSHELRTPLNAILNFADFLRMEMLGPVSDTQKHFLENISGSGHHLLDLINDVLDIAKIQAGMMNLFVEPDVDLYPEIAAVIAAVDSLVNEGTVTFVKDIDADLPRISGDRRRIRQILLNLLSNAAKFTERGTITFSVKNRGSEIMFAVLDSGPGIPEDDQAVIFEPFRQTDAGIKHGTGTGLGLAISRLLAEAHGGKLWVESSPGEGASFFVVIPIAAIPP